MKPSGGRAVVEQRAGLEVEGDDDQTRLWRRLELFPTPPWATRAGVEVVRAIDPLLSTACDPCCGLEHMLGPLREMVDQASGFDVYPHTPTTQVRDWLDDEAWSDVFQLGRVRPDWFFANPPFTLGAEFVRRGLKRARHGVAILQRLTFLEAENRQDIFTGSQPLTQLAVFVDRVGMKLGRWDGKGTATAYAWFIWRKGAAPLPPTWIPAGTKARLTRADDFERYGSRAPSPLLGDLG